MVSLRPPWQKWSMTKRSLKSVLFAVITLPLFLAGCASQPLQETPSKQETPAKPKTAIDHPASPMEATAGIPPEPENEAEELPKITEESTVFFTRGSAALNYREKQKLEIIAERLTEDRNLRVTLLGHANDNGSSSFNLAVSDNRVNVVAAFLRKRGVHGSQITARALVSGKVASNCRSSSCRQKFRRVDLLITKGK